MAHHGAPFSTLTLTKSEAAEALGVSRNTVVRLVKRGVLTEVVFAEGMQPRIRAADLYKLLGPTPEERKSP